VATPVKHIVPSFRSYRTSSAMYIVRVGIPVLFYYMANIPPSNEYNVKFTVKDKTIEYEKPSLET